MSRNVYIPVLLALLVIGTYLPVRNHEFVNYDDPDYVTANAQVQRGFTIPGVAWAFGNIHGQNTYWHPLTWISHMLDVEWFGLQPGPHHLVNLFWHMLNVILLFFLLQQLTGKAWRSAMVAALFAMHPLQVDSVAWVTERKNLLSTFFLFVTVMAYLRYTMRPTIARNAIVVVLFALGLMTKPALVTLPCLLLVLDYWPLRRWNRANSPPETPANANDAPTLPVMASIQQLVVEKLPLFALSAISSYLTIAAHKGLGMVQQGAELSLVYRLENALVSYVRYMAKVFWPVNLSVLYPHPGAWPRWQVIAAGALLLAITDQVIRHGKRRPYLITGWLWFLGTLFPAIGIVQVGTQAMADRFAYVPIIGLFIMIVWLASDWAARLVQKPIALAVAGCAVIAACVAITTVQLRHWKNSRTLMEHVVAVTKDNYMAHHNLGVALIEEHKLDEALTQLRRAVQIRTNAFSLQEMGRAYELQGRTNDAILVYLEADKAVPTWVAPRKRVVAVLTQFGQTNAALELCVGLLQRAPRDPEVHYELGTLLIGQNVEKAMSHYLEAMKLNPNYIPALNNLAWILSTHTDAKVRSGSDAVGIATRACVLTQWKQPQMLATLAAANAEAGNFPEAIRLAQQAREIMNRSGGDLATLEKMLKEFQAGKPHRES